MKQLLRVLLVEDNEDDALLLARELRRGDYQLRIERVETGEQMRAALTHEERDVIIADYSLPHFSAPEALTVAKELAPNTPFLVISGTVGETAAVDTLRAGAQDFILKGQWARLLPALARELRDAEVRKERRKAESDYLMLFNEMLDGFAVHEIVTDDQGKPVDYRFLAVNPAFERMTGLRADDVVGRTVLAVLPTLESTWIERYGHVALTGEPTRFEMFSSPLGKHFQVSVFSPSPGQFATVFTDVTERRQVEEELRRSEERFFSAFEFAPIGMALVAPDGHWLRVNRALCELVGYPEEELLEKTFQDISHPDDLEADLNYVRRLLAGEIKTFQMEKRYFRKSGETVWVLLSVSLVWDAQGHPLTLVSQILDITARKQAEAAMRLQSTALNAAANAIAITDIDGVIQWVNPAWTALTGYTAEETIGRNPRLLKSGMHDVAFYRQLWSTILANQVWRGETVNRRKDGSLYTEEQTITPLEDSDHRITHFIAIKQDITERRRTTARLQAETARTQSLLGISRRLNTTLDLDAVLNTICEEAARVLDAPAASINLFDEELQIFRHAAAFGVPPSYSQRHRPMPLALRDQFASVINRPVTVIPDIQAVANIPNADLFAELDVRTVVVTHLTRDRQLIGSLQVLTFGETREFDDDKLELITGLADQAAIAITNAQLYAQADLRLKRLRALHAIDRAITAPQGLAAPLDTVVEQVATQLHVDAVAVLLYHPERQTLEFAAGIGFRGDAIRRTPVTFGKGYAGRAASERHIQFHDLQEPTLPAVRAAFFAEEGFVSHFSVPLIAQVRLLGVLEIFQRTWLEPNAEWLAFLEALALQAAIAVDHAALFMRTQEQARQLNQVLVTVPEGIVMLDASRRLVMANPEGRRCLALLTTAEVGDVITHLGGAPTAPLLTTASQPQDVQEIVLPDDETAFEVTAGPVRDNSSVTGWVMILRDVTTVRRHRMILAQQERLAAVGQLAAGIAHDFNNILTPIRLSIDLSVDDAPVDSRLRAGLKQIGAATDRARDLVAQILAFSRRDLQTRPAPLRVRPIVEEALNLVRAGLPAHVEIRQSLSDADAHVLALPGQIHQTVMNLCTNAFHAMQASSGVLTVVLEEVTLDAALPVTTGMLPPGVYVCLTVSDTGHGMDRATMNRIFEPFFTTKSPGKGTGMGLSVVLGIVVEAGGGIQVNSTPGEGSEFRVYLPQITTPTDSVPETGLVTEAGAGRILVVDDEVAITTALRAVLERLGYIVATASDGREALTILSQDPMRFDLVIADLTMPRMSGLELAAAIADLPDALPVILMSGYTETVGPDAYAEAGIRDFLTKPFNAQTVSVAIRRVLSTPD